MQNNRKKLLVIFVLTLVIVAMLLTVLACEPGFELTVVNGTDQVLTIYVVAGRSNDPAARRSGIKPGESWKTPGLWLIYYYYTIIAKNDKGETVYSREFNYDELRDDFKFKVVIKTPENK